MAHEMMTFRLVSLIEISSIADMIRRTVVRDRITRPRLSPLSADAATAARAHRLV
jgi:hypothetical protein